MAVGTGRPAAGMNDAGQRATPFSAYDKEGEMI